ncbi:hypothetical protein V8F33_007831 [Rhypophila sp. PSN 637]
MRHTMRSLLDYSSMCPFPEANRPLHIGRFGVGEEVKTRALRRILRRRIKGLLVMLEDMTTTDVLTSVREGNNPNNNASTKQHIPRTSTVAGASEAGLGKSVRELYLRVESTLGRLDLTC